tara:strand:+ start:4806 stop:7484 length:2679 start_codon:yes stop_codon:yes gene_type:complete
MEKLKKILWYIFEPTPLKLGLLITFFVTKYSFDYYVLKDLGISKDSGFLSKFVHDLHLKTIDYKLLFRGERKGHPDIAILTVDQRAIDHFGRWPWPRSRTAEIINELMSYDAKILAFDIVFSESDVNEQMLLLQDIKKEEFNDQRIYSVLENKLNQVNTDNQLTTAIENHADNLVMGGFFNTEGFQDGISQKCSELLAYNMPDYDFLSMQEIIIGLIDSSSFYIPDELATFLEMQFQRIANETASSAPPDIKEIDLKNNILHKQISYCFSWLSSDDKTLPQLKELYEQSISQSEDWQGKSFDEFRTTLLNLRKSPLEHTLIFTNNIEEYNSVTKHYGYFNAFPDSDGTIRQTALIAKLGDVLAPSLALKTALLAKGRLAAVYMDPNPAAPSEKKVSSLDLMDNETAEVTSKIPVNSAGYLKINYAGPQKTFPHLSVAELLNGKETATIEMRHEKKEQKFTINKKEWVKDKIFLLGPTAIGIYDMRVTPFEEVYPGVEVHANIIDNILRKDFLSESHEETAKMAIVILVLGVLSSIIVAKFGALVGLIFTLVAMAGGLYIDYYYFFLQGTTVSVILPILLLIGLYFTLTIFKYFTEERKKRELKGTFAKYVSPAIVDEVLKDAKNIELGGKKIRMSVLFSDVRGFTSISEKLDPQALGDFLNSYLTPMTDLVFENKGALDKYMGDAVMAFFGAPIHYADHAYMSCKCALDMMDKLAELQEGYKKEGLPPIDIGIGINTGDMSVGNMGSETVRSYTVMGDAVNLGSRLEGINKQYGTNIIISEFTYEDCKDQIIAREIDRVQVKGKLEPVRIFELVDLKARFKDEQKQKVLDLYNEGYHQYMQKNFEQAIALFDQALAIDPEDGPSILFKGRAEIFLREPPPSDWDGVFIMTTK